MGEAELASEDPRPAIRAELSKLRILRRYPDRDGGLRPFEIERRIMDLTRELEELDRKPIPFVPAREAARRNKRT